MLPDVYTLENYATVFADSTRMIWNTFLYCGVAALIDVVIGTAIAYLVLRTRRRPAAARPHGDGRAGDAGRGAGNRLPHVPGGRGAVHRDAAHVELADLRPRLSVRRLPYALRSCMAARCSRCTSRWRRRRRTSARRAADDPAHRRAADGRRHPRRLRHPASSPRRSRSPRRSYASPAASLARCRTGSTCTCNRSSGAGRGGARRDRGRRRARSVPMHRTTSSRRGRRTTLRGKVREDRRTRTGARGEAHEESNVKGPVRVEARDVNLAFGTNVVLRDIDMVVEPGEFFAARTLRVRQVDAAASSRASTARSAARS